MANRLDLRQRIGKVFLHDTLTSTATGGTSTTLLDTKQTAPTDTFIGAEIVVTSGPAVNDYRIVTAFTQASGTFTVNRAFTSTPANGDTYELLQANAERGAIAEVVKRANAALKANPNVRIRDDEDRIALLDYYCSEVESDLLEQARDAHQRLSKLKKLQPQGITPHTTSDTSLTSSELPTEAQALLTNLDTLGATSTKFLTNASTLSAPPSRVSSAKTFTVRNEQDADLERLLNELQR